MRLLDLSPQFLRWVPQTPTEDQREANPDWPADKLCDTFEIVETFAEAHGVRFICPKSRAFGNPHGICVMFEGSPVPDHLFKNKDGVTVRWKASGTGYHDLTLLPSIEEQDGGRCGWHGFVTSGEAIH